MPSIRQVRHFVAGSTSVFKLYAYFYFPFAKVQNKKGEERGEEKKVVDNSFASKSARRPLTAAVGRNSLQLQCEMRENSSRVQIREGGVVE